MIGPEAPGPDRPGPADVLSVSGGVAGLAAAYDAVLRLSHRYDAAGDRLRGWAADGARVMKNGDLVESGLLSPATCAVAEAAILAATVGPDGLVVDSLHWEADAIAVRTTVDLLEAADDVSRAEMQAVDSELGFALGLAITRLGPLTWPIVLGLAEDPDALSEHPGIVRHLADGSGGLLAGLTSGALGVPLPVPTEQQGAEAVALLYDEDGRPIVAPVPITVDGSTSQPDSVEDLIEHLSHVADLSPEPDSPLNGTIEIQTITDTDGTVRHIVYLPGTDDLTTTPWSEDGDVRDLTTNLQLVGGEPDTYQQGILQALHEAGVRPGDPVAIVGHSQGGMEAAAILAHHHDFHVTDVVTAGSPTAQVGAFPDGSHVLSLVQQGDIVPQLAGQLNPDSVPQTTLTFDAHPGAGVLAHHSYSAYTSGAAAADASSSPSVHADISSLHAHGYLGDGSHVQVTSQVFQITRGR